MSYFGIPRGRNKALATMRLVIVNSNSTNNAQLTLDDGTPTTVTYYPGTWLQLFAAASVTTNINMVELFDSTGFTARIGTGALGSETDLFMNLPGGNGQVPVRINAGTRIVAQPISSSLAVGAELTMNFYD